MQDTIEIPVLMLAPITPHICHELWKILRHNDAIMNADWPNIDEYTLFQNNIDIMYRITASYVPKYPYCPIQII